MSYEAAKAIIARCLDKGRTVFACGNGGSAEQANHFVAELVGRYKRERAPYRAVSLASNMATITAIANDYGYEHIFSRQLAGLGVPGDALLAISTSWRSQNVLNAVWLAKERGIRVVGLSNIEPPEIEHVTWVKALSTDTADVQEAHLGFIHGLCEYAEDYLEDGKEESNRKAHGITPHLAGACVGDM